MRTQSRSRGFTLIELMVVIMILGVLITLLMPTITTAMLIVRVAMTHQIIKDLQNGIEAFHNDFGCYPPSRPRVPTDTTLAKTDPKSGDKSSGAANLVYYLSGPARSGWGTPIGGTMPFGTGGFRAYGPYYLAAQEDIAKTSPTDGSAPVVMGFLDAFKPPGRILYWRYDPNPDIDSGTGAPKPSYEVADNGVNPTDATKNDYNYAGGPGGTPTAQTRFEEIVHPTTPTSRWVRADYLLVSPGPDGRYGYKTTDTATGQIISASKPSAASSTVTIDDITNWN